MLSFSRITALCALGALLCAMQCSSPTKPQPPANPVDTAVGEYDVLFRDRNSPHSFYVLNSKTSELMRTFEWSYDGERPVFSADGQKVYLAGPDSIAVVDYATDISDTFLNFPSFRIKTSPDNLHIALSDGYSGLYVLKLPGYEEVFRDSIPLNSLHGYSFSPNGETFVVSHGSDVTVRTVVDSFSELYQFTTQFPISLGAMSCLNDGSQVFHSRAIGPFQAMFEVYNARNGELLYDTFFQNASQWGDLTVTPDEDYVFFSFPGDPRGIGLDCSICVYDIAGSHMVEWEKVRRDSSGLVGGLGGNLAITPDGKRLITSSGFWVDGSQTITIVDIPSLTIDTFFRPLAPLRADLSEFTIQSMK